MVSARMRTSVTRRWLLICAALAALLLAIGVIVALQPATADRFGYALPGPHGLPSHFKYDG